MKRYPLGVIVAVAAVLAVSELSYAGNYSQQLQGIRQNIWNVEKEKMIRQEILKELNQTMIILDEKIDEGSKKIENISQNIKKKQEEIAITQGEVLKYQSIINKNAQRLSQRLKVMYRTSDIDYLRVILQSQDMAEVLSNVTMIKRIVKKDKEVLQNLQKSKEAIEVEKSKLEKQERAMLSLKNGLEAEKTSLERAIIRQQESKEQIKKDLYKLAVMAEQMFEEANNLEGKIRELQQVYGMTGPYIGGKMAWPVAVAGRVTSGYGGRVNPITHRTEVHSGVDIAAPFGTDILSANDGRVIFAGNKGSYGKAIMVDHGGGIVTLYGHCSSFVASEGQMVMRGQPIAKIGSTGYSTGPHLHFEVRINGKHVNPSGYIGL